MLTFLCVSFGGIIAFPASSLPVEIFLHSDSLQQPAPADDESSHKARSTLQFNVRDKDHVCNVELQSTKLLLGESVLVHFDFSASKQSCVAVKASLVMTEKCADESPVQVSLFCLEDLFSLFLRRSVVNTLF